VSRLNVQMVISARDQSQGAIRSALGGLARFTRVATRPVTMPLQVGTAAIRSLGRLGLAGLGVQSIRQIGGALDGLIEKGARLGVVRQNFEALTGLGGERADLLARVLRDSAHGALSLGRSLEVVNKGLAAGLTRRQLADIFDFGARKGLAIGERPADLIASLVDAIATGKTRMLDDLALLRDGVEGVAAAFDVLHGKGAFEGLSKSQQTAQVAASVVRDMKLQLVGLGVSGRETAFAWMRIKSEMADARDKLAAALVGSRAFRDVLGGVGTILKGLERHFQGGGTLGQIFFGRNGAPGLFQVAGAGLRDLGGAVGGGIASAFGTVVDRLKAIAEDLPNRIRAGLGELIDVLRRLLAPLDRFGRWLTGAKAGPPGSDLGGWQEDLARGMFVTPGLAGVVGSTLMDMIRRAFVGRGAGRQRTRLSQPAGPVSLGMPFPFAAAQSATFGASEQDRSEGRAAAVKFDRAAAALLGAADRFRKASKDGGFWSEWGRFSGEFLGGAPGGSAAGGGGDLLGPEETAQTGGRALPPQRGRVVTRTQRQRLWGLIEKRKRFLYAQARREVYGMIRGMSRHGAHAFSRGEILQMIHERWVYLMGSDRALQAFYAMIGASPTGELSLSGTSGGAGGGGLGGAELGGVGGGPSAGPRGGLGVPGIGGLSRRGSSEPGGRPAASDVGLLVTALKEQVGAIRGLIAALGGDEASIAAS